MRWPWTPYGRTELISWGATSFAITLTTLYFYPWLAIVPAAACAFILNFFRDPERPISGEPGVLVSPADGKVTDITRLPENEYVGGEAIRVGIFLNVFNVHVNRVPCAGRVDYLRHREGKYLDARDPNCATENERQDLGLIAEGPDGRPMKVLVRQIAGLIARRIVCPVTVGQELGRGERYGMIKFGSRTEIYLPLESGFEALVQVGDIVKGGATVLGRMTGIAVDSDGTTSRSAAILATGSPPVAEPEADVPEAGEAAEPEKPVEPKEPLPEKPVQPEKEPIPQKPAEPEKPVQPEKKPLPEQPEKTPLPPQPNHPGPPPQPAEPPAPEPPKAEGRLVDAGSEVTPDPKAEDPDEEAVAAPEPPASAYHETSASMPTTVQEYEARASSPDHQEPVEPVTTDAESKTDTEIKNEATDPPSVGFATPSAAGSPSEREVDSTEHSKTAAAGGTVEDEPEDSDEMAEVEAEIGREDEAAEAGSTEAKPSKKERRARRKKQRGAKRKKDSPEMAGEDMSDEDELEDDESSHDHSPSTSGNQSS